MAEGDILVSTLCTITLLVLLSAFTGALFLERYRRELAILSGIMTALLLVAMVLALAAPFIFSP
ncbi:MAG: hypothetical protein ACFFD2_27045 [Promethearchaeota archaeon]